MGADAPFRILQGDALAVLRTLPAESVHCCVTSPPYWGLRDYGADGQIGLERTPDEYVARLVEVFREVRRVLRADGTLWMNLGDAYCSGTGAPRKATSTEGPAVPAGWASRCQKERIAAVGDIKAKDLIGIPWLVAFALRADGWYLRSDIIWAKPNPMPESVTDRPTKAHEYLFLLSKSERYYYDAEAIKEPIAEATARDQRIGTERVRDYDQASTDFGEGTSASRRSAGNAFGDPSGRNRRTVWTVATQPYKESHFAVMPRALVEPCVKAGTSERGVCPECGAPWERVTERTPMEVATSSKGADKHGAGLRTSTSGTMTRAPTSKTVGWRPCCKCAAAALPPCFEPTDDAAWLAAVTMRGLAPVPATVIDPFNGAGTTGLVATRLQRRYVGIELNPDYVAMSEKRIRGDAPLFHGAA